MSNVDSPTVLALDRLGRILLHQRRDLGRLADRLALLVGSEVLLSGALVGRLLVGAVELLDQRLGLLVDLVPFLHFVGLAFRLLLLLLGLLLLRCYCLLLLLYLLGGLLLARLGLGPLGGLGRCRRGRLLGHGLLLLHGDGGGILGGFPLLRLLGDLLRLGGRLGRRGGRSWEGRDRTD